MREFVFAPLAVTLLALAALSGGCGLDSRQAPPATVETKAPAETVAAESRPAVLDRLIASTDLADGPVKNWYAVFLGDVKLGHDEETISLDGDLLRCSSDMTFSMDRFGTPLVIKFKIESVETLDAQPRGMKVIARMGPLTLSRHELDFTFSGEKLIYTSYSGGRPRSEIVELDDEIVITPLATLAKTVEFVNRGASCDQYTTFDLDAGRIQKVRMENLGKEDVSILGRTMRLQKIRQHLETSGSKVISDTWYDDAFTLQRSQLTVQGMRLDIVRCSREFALASGPGFKVADLTLPCPFDLDALLADAEDQETARIALTIARPEGNGFQPPDIDEQHVATLPDGALTVISGMIVPENDEPVAYTGSDPDVRKRLKPTRYLESDDATIIAQAREIIDGIEGRYDAALAIQLWVSSNLDMAMDVPYDSAAQTLAGRRGDCTEHALLTAALCRAAGIPCRVVGGLAYAGSFGGLKNTFIGHAWNQVYVDGRWVRIDAAYGQYAPRIACVVGDGDPMDMASTFDALKVTILSAELAARERQEASPQIK